MIIPAYRLGFSVQIAVGEFGIRTRRRCYQVAFAVQCHLIGYRVGEHVRNRWAFVQFGDWHTFWLRRY